MKKSLVIFLVFLHAGMVLAQSDFDESGDDFANDFKDDLSDKLSEDKKDDFKDNNSSTSAKAEVSKSDIESLSKAVKSKSEASIIRAASDILSKDPTHLQALNALGLMYFDTRRYGMAKIIFRRALNDHADEPALFNNLGIVYLAEGDIRLALENFKKSVAAKSRYRVGATNLSSIYLEYRDFKRSLAPLEEAYDNARSDLRRGSNSSVEIANNYAVALMGLGEDSKSGKVFEEIVDSGSRNPVPFLNYAILLVEVQKKKKEAIRILSKLKFMTEDRGILRQAEELERKIE